MTSGDISDCQVWVGAGATVGRGQECWWKALPWVLSRWPRSHCVSALFLVLPGDSYINTKQTKMLTEAAFGHT